MEITLEKDGDQETILQTQQAYNHINITVLLLEKNKIKEKKWTQISYGDVHKL